MPPNPGNARCRPSESETPPSPAAGASHIGVGCQFAIQVRGAQFFKIKQLEYYHYLLVIVVVRGDYTTTC